MSTLDPQREHALKIVTAQSELTETPTSQAGSPTQEANAAPRSFSITNTAAAPESPVQYPDLASVRNPVVMDRQILPHPVDAIPASAPVQQVLAETQPSAPIATVQPAAAPQPLEEIFNPAAVERLGLSPQPATPELQLPPQPMPAVSGPALNPETQPGLSNLYAQPASPEMQPHSIAAEPIPTAEPELRLPPLNATPPPATAQVPQIARQPSIEQGNAFAAPQAPIQELPAAPPGLFTGQPETGFQAAPQTPVETQPQIVPLPPQTEAQPQLLTQTRQEQTAAEPAAPPEQLGVASAPVQAVSLVEHATNNAAAIPQMESAPDAAEPTASDAAPDSNAPTAQFNSSALRNAWDTFRKVNPVDPYGQRNHRATSDWNDLRSQRMTEKKAA